jgi:hypothetical protein
MEAKIIADTIIQMSDMARANEISLKLHGAVNAALWELATLKGKRGEVHAILKAYSLELFGVLDEALLETGGPLTDAERREAERMVGLSGR